jgi:Flp pilus assembly protein TadD
VTYETRSIDVLRLQGKTDQALERTTKSLENHPDNADLIFLKASLLIADGGVQREEGVHMLEKILQAHDVPEYHNALGRAYASMGYNDKAGEQFKAAFARNPQYLEPQRALAELDLQQRKYKEAAQVANTILASVPNDPASRLTRAVAMAGQGDITQANIEILQLRKEFPTAIEPRLALADLRLSQGHFDEAEALYSSAKIGPKLDNRAVEGLAQTYFFQKRPEKALKLVQENVTSQGSTSAQTRFLLAEAEMAAGQPDRAAEEYQHLISQDPKSYRLHLRLGDALMQQNRFKEAVSCYEKARQLSPGDSETVALLARAYEGAGQKDRAKQAYRDVLKLRPDNVPVLNNLAYLIADTGGNLDEAMQLAEDAHRRAPQDPRIADTIGWIYLKKHTPQAAIQVFSNNVRSAPANPTYRYHLALALIDVGDFDHAKKNLDAAVSNHPPELEMAQIRQTLASLPAHEVPVPPR